VALSTALREVIPMMNLIQELKDNGFPFHLAEPTIHCTVFEDNDSAYEMAKTPKMRPRTKHINVEYHHLHAEAEEGNIILEKIDTFDQQVYIFTKPTDTPLFKKFRKLIMGW
jgi:hypothetical protein